MAIVVDKWKVVENRCWLRENVPSEMRMEHAVVSSFLMVAYAAQSFANRKSAPPPPQ